VSAITLTQLCDEDHNQTSHLDAETRRIVRNVAKQNSLDWSKLTIPQKCD